MKQKLIVSILVIVFAMIGCASMTQKQAYYAARSTFNDALESYIGQKLLVNSETQNDWEYKIEPLFRDANFALDMWAVALNTPEMSVIDKERAYNKIRLDLFRLLFSYGIIEIK